MTTTISKPQASVTELIIVLGIAFGQFIAVSLQSFVSHAAQLSNAEQVVAFSDELLIDLVGYEIFVGLMCCIILAVRGWTLADFHLRPSWKLTAIGFLLLGLHYAMYYATYSLMALMIGTQVLEATSFEFQASLIPIILLSVVNPLFEEVFVVGYAVPVVERLSNGGGAILFSTVFRLLYHLYQGPIAFVHILPLGLMFAFFYWRWRKLWPLLVAHAALDFIPLAFG